jgi:hypothetical protein
MSTSFKNTIPFNPRSISGLQLWLDAADSSSYTITSSRVMQWNDKSGNNYHMTPIGANQSNITVSSQFQNSLNVMNSTGRVMYRTPINSAVYPSDCYLVLASKALARTDFFSFGNTTGDNFNSLTLGEHTALRWHNGSTNFNRTPNTVSPVNETSTGFLLMQWSLANNNYILRRNGTLLTQTSSYTYTIGGNPAYQIGYRHTDQTTSLLDCAAYFAEILVFNSQITTSQREQVEGYLAWKWGLNANLPSTHPFRSGLVPFQFTLQRTPAKFTQIFDPRSISGCQLWFDGADVSTLTLSGNSVSQWRDKARGFHVTSGGTSPTYNTSTRAVTFNGNGYLINSTFSYALATRSVFLVCSQTSASSTTTFEGFLVFGASNVTDYDNINAIVYNGRGTNAIANLSFGVFFRYSQNNIGDYRLNYLTSTTPTPFGIYADVFSNPSGTLFVNGATTTSDSIAGSIGTSTGFFLGARNDFGNGTYRSFLNGSISEVIVFNTALTTAQRQAIEGYLARKWNISLVSTHPNANPITVAPFSHEIVPRSMKPNRFTPTQIPGCQLWLDAADASTISLSGTNVTQWNDKSGNGRHASKTTATTNPVYMQNALNKRPVLANTGSSGLSGTLAVNTLTNLFIFVVCNDTSAAEFANNTGGYVLWWNEAGAWGQIQMYISQSRLDWRFGTGQSENKPTFNLPSNVSTNYNIACIAKSSRTEVGYLNGLTVGTYTAANSAIANTSSTYVITGPASASSYATNNIAEILIYSSSLQTINRQQIEGYLAWKWGLQGNLPATHPYANFPPPP